MVWWISGAIVLAIVAWRFLPEVENPLAPEPVRALVAVAAGDAKVAQSGRFDLPAGTPFRLFAVLEARDWRGRSVWYTEAPGLTIEGESIAANRVLRWPAELRVQVRWLTVEPFAPYLEVGTADDLDRLRYVDEFHPEWGSGWSAAGAIDPRLAVLGAGSPLRPLPFGTQRYAVRIERFVSDQALTPATRWSSPGADDVSANSAAATSVVGRLPAPLAIVSAAVGRIVLGVQDSLDEVLAARLVALHARGEAVVATRLWADHLDASGRTPGDLVWRPTDLAAAELVWGQDVEPGDLLQAGDRLVVLWRDEGIAGRLDPADRVFDASRGLRLVRIDEVFRGSDGLAVEIAQLELPVGH